MTKPTLAEALLAAMALDDAGAFPPGEEGVEQILAWIKGALKEEPE